MMMGATSKPLDGNDRTVLSCRRSLDSPCRAAAPGGPAIPWSVSIGTVELDGAFGGHHPGRRLIRIATQELGAPALRSSCSIASNEHPSRNSSAMSRSASRSENSGMSSWRADGTLGSGRTLPTSLRDPFGDQNLQCFSPLRRGLILETYEPVFSDRYR